MSSHHVKLPQQMEMSMQRSSAVFVGFFPKLTQPADAWLGNESVREVCSVSNCISAGPEDWVNQWQHNELGFYDSESLAQGVAGEAAHRFDLYAYRLFPVRCLTGAVETFPLDTASTAAQHLPPDYTFLGYDIVTRASSSFFECSPLSCNAAAREYPVNQYCLIDDLDVAYKSLLAICAQDVYEPGPYYLFEVHRKKRKKRYTRSLSPDQASWT